MIYYKTAEEVELIRECCTIVSKALAHVASRIQPGITGKQIDKEAEELIRDHQASPAFKGYRGFPATLCISVNEGVVHGIPSDVPFKEGDIVSVDCGSYKHGFFGDSAYTFALGEVDPKIMELLEVTNTALYKGIAAAVSGNRIGDIGHAVQYYCEKENPYSVVRELVGHGLGRDLHEAPEVPNFGKRGKGTKIQDGLVIAIEPMINLGRKEVRQSRDGWTIITKDLSPSAHYEHTICVTKDKADILSDHSLVEAQIQKNDAVREVGVRLERTA
ncbi:MAG: type I methionyl aminopeptidase [Bacteroidota bacterium]